MHTLVGNGRYLSFNMWLLPKPGLRYFWINLHKKNGHYCWPSKGVKMTRESFLVLKARALKVLKFNLCKKKKSTCALK